ANKSSSNSSSGFPVDFSMVSASKFLPITTFGQGSSNSELLRPWVSPLVPAIQCALLSTPSSPAAVRLQITAIFCKIAFGPLLDELGRRVPHKRENPPTPFIFPSARSWWSHDSVEPFVELS